MDAFRHHRSPPAERFLGLFSSPPGNLTAAAASAGGGDDDDGSTGVELHEDEVLWTGADFSVRSPSPTTTAAVFPYASSSGGFRGFSDKNHGILTALAEEETRRSVRKPSLLQRNFSSISSTSPPSTSPSSSISSARMIPAIPKPKHPEYSLSVPGAKIQHQSAPVNVPVVPRRQSRRPVEEADEEDCDDDGMLPPHEMVARKETPTTTFSVLEGVGRTLKGRDLRQVRNAVWRQTENLDFSKEWECAMLILNMTSLYLS